MTAAFGDFLDLTTAGLSEAAAVRDLPSSTVIAATSRLQHVVTALSRPVASPRTFPEPAAAAILSAGLHQAAVSLRRAAAAGAGLPGPGLALPLPARITGAATGLMAGLDLLATHHTPSPGNAEARLSPWAPALASPPARAALLAEITSLAALTGAACRALAAVPSPALPQTSRDALLAAGRQLTAAADIPGSQAHGAGTAWREFLRAVPLPITPPRQPPAQPEPPGTLAQEISRTADRIRSLSRQPPAPETWPPPPGLAAWRWSAHAAAITGHLSEQILTQLAARARHTGPDGLAPALSHAATIMGTSWNTWRQAASTSAMHAGTTIWNTPHPVRDDLDDLITRLGRIAHDNPAWTPAATHRAPLKPPASLAPGAGEFRTVLAAVHHAADALIHIASANLTAIQAAIRTSRIHEQAIPVPGTASPASTPGSLQQAHEQAQRAACAAAQAIDHLAAAAHAPSTHLALMRLALAPQPETLRDELGQPGQARARLLAAEHDVKQHHTVALARASFPRRPITAHPVGRQPPARTPQPAPGHSRAAR